MRTDITGSRDVNQAKVADPLDTYVSASARLYLEASRAVIAEIIYNRNAPKQQTDDASQIDSES